MLRKLLRVLGIVLAAAIVIGAALMLYLEPYVTYDRDGAHLSLKKNAQDPDGTGATAALPEVSDAQIVYDEAQPGSDRIADLGGVYVTTQMLRDPEAVRAALEQQGACAVLLQLKSTFGNFYYSSSIDGAELADVDTAQPARLLPHCGGSGLLRHGVCAGQFRCGPPAFERRAVDGLQRLLLARPRERDRDDLPQADRA